MTASPPYYPALITGVASRSAASRARLRVGDHLLAINGVPLRDVIDVQIYAAEPELDFLIERGGKRVTRRCRRRYGEPLGLDFAEPLFDGAIRRCQNRCEFCFVTQMPPGLRDPLYVKDDDYRLSFLHGNYVTLTNLRAADWERIAEQFLSPLYVSVHATEPEVRAGLLRHPRAGDILTHLRRLVDIGIEVHTQAVLIPGRNDGAHLDRTLADLAALRPGVVDVTVVPVGLTRWHAPGLRPFTDAESLAVLAQVSGWQDRLRGASGTRFVYASDECYLRAGQPVPELDAYDALLPALLENGVGMVRAFLEDWPAWRAALIAAGGTRQCWVTGVLFAPVLWERGAAFTRETGIPAEVVAVPNHFFGETVTVAGLLTGGDVIAALGRLAADTVIILPDEMFRGPGGRTLDGLTLAEMRQALGCAVVTVGLSDG